MNSTDVSAAPPVDFVRAGFWRRLMTALIDGIIVLLPFQIAAAILFAATAGQVQMYGGLTFKYCDKSEIPQALNPPPPRDSNFAILCQTKLFGATTGILLTVGRTTKEGSVTKTITQGYMVDQEGKPIDGFTVDWIALLALLVYLIAMIGKTGKTIGARILGIRFVDAVVPERIGLSPWKVILRYLAMFIGSVPALALLAYRKISTDGSADAMFAGSFFQWFTWTMLIAVVWYVWLVVQVARKKDPTYDRLAGTMVLKDPHSKNPT